MTVLAADNNFPDSTFIEDAALLTRKCAILTNPGAPSRNGEPATIEGPLRRFYENMESITGTGTIDAGDSYNTVDVEIRHSSSGRVRTSIFNGDNVDAIMSGSGRIDLYGEADAASYTLNSSGKIDALELMVASAVATITGSGKIFLYATDYLNATITGSGDVLYRGSPTISFQITGSGSVKPY